MIGERAVEEERKQIGRYGATSGLSEPGKPSTNKRCFLNLRRDKTTRIAAKGRGQETREKTWTSKWDTKGGRRGRDGGGEGGLRQLSRGVGLGGRRAVPGSNQALSTKPPRFCVAIPIL